MNALAVGLLAYVLLGLELALKPTLGLGQSGIAPSLLIPLVMYVAMFAPAGPTLWLALLTGAAIDLTGPRALDGGGAIWVIGPHALGYALAGYAGLQLRALLVRGNPLSLAVLSLVAAVLAGIVAVAVLALRMQVEQMLGYTARMAFAARGDLGARLGSAVYTAVVALPLAMVFRSMMGLLGLHDPHARRFGR